MILLVIAGVRKSISPGLFQITCLSPQLWKCTMLRGIIIYCCTCLCCLGFVGMRKDARMQLLLVVFPCLRVIVISKLVCNDESVFSFVYLFGSFFYSFDTSKACYYLPVQNYEQNRYYISTYFGCILAGKCHIVFDVAVYT